jgi:hypothetical protein
VIREMVFLTLLAVHRAAAQDVTTTTTSLPPYQHSYDAEGNEVYSGDDWSATVFRRNIARPTGRGVDDVIYLDAVTGESIREVTRCNFEIKYKRADGTMQHTSYEVGCLISPSVGVTVTALSAGTLRYSYSLLNKEGSPQAISQVKIVSIEGLTLSAQHGASGWSMPGGVSGGVVSVGGRTDFGWIPLGTNTDLAGGGSITGLIAETSYLAGVTTALVTGIPNNRVVTFDEPLQWALDSAVTALEERGDVHVDTVGPMRAVPAHVSADRQAAIEWMISDIDRAKAVTFVGSGESQLRAILARARDNESSNAALLQAATDANAVSGIASDYKAAIVANLQLLAQ